MWQDLLNWFRVLWDTGTQTQENTTRIEKLSQQDVELARSFDNLAAQQQHDREMNERRVQKRMRQKPATSSDVAGFFVFWRF